MSHLRKMEAGAPYQIPAAVGEGNRAALSVVRWLRNA